MILLSKNFFILCSFFLFGFLTVLKGQDDFFEPGTTIGGYGELHFNKSKNEIGNIKNTLDFHRFVLFVSHGFSEKWSFKSEVELEHNIVEENQGALELEQAYIDYHFSNYLGFQAGVVLPSVGILNELHEPPTFFGVERPEYHKYIIPTTWFGNGLAVYGNYHDFDYKITVMEGLNSDKFSFSSGIRSGRQEGFKSNADNLLYNLRVNYLGFQNILFGSSFTYNKAKGDSTEIPVFLIEAHFQANFNDLILRGEAGNINYSTGTLKSSFGYYFDLGYDLSRLFKIDWSIVPFFRFTEYNASERVRNTLNVSNGVTKWMFGLTVKPLNEIVLKFDYAERNMKKETGTEKLFNLGVGYMF